jgi:hypothetical protein
MTETGIADITVAMLSYTRKIWHRLLMIIIRGRRGIVTNNYNRQPLLRFLNLVSKW